MKLPPADWEIESGALRWQMIWDNAYHGVKYAPLHYGVIPVYAQLYVDTVITLLPDSAMDFEYLN